MRHDTKHIILAIQTEGRYGRDFHRGVRIYAAHRPQWQAVAILPQSLPLALRGAIPVDGIIGDFAHAKHYALVAKRRIPAVNMGAFRPGGRIPLIVPDNAGIGRVAAEHFLDRGFTQFAVCGGRGLVFSRDRENAFTKALGARGFRCSRFASRAWFFKPGRLTSEAFTAPAEMIEWLRSLPKPVAVFAINDYYASHVIQACHAAGLSIPGDVAVLGVDDDERFHSPDTPLSSITMPVEKIGYEAAALLDRMLAGKVPPVRPVVIPGASVTLRTSTDIVAVGDVTVANAIRFIRQHINEPVNVESLLQSLGVPRRTLEMKFRKALGRTPLAVQTQIRMEHVKHLLSRTDMPLADIARKSGFANASRLCVVFRKRTGLTPVGYRRSGRLG